MALLHNCVCICVCVGWTFIPPLAGRHLSLLTTGCLATHAACYHFRGDNFTSGSRSNEDDEDSSYSTAHKKHSGWLVLRILTQTTNRGDESEALLTPTLLTPTLPTPGQLNPTLLTPQHFLPKHYSAPNITNPNTTHSPTLLTPTLFTRTLLTTTLLTPTLLTPTLLTPQHH